MTLLITSVTDETASGLSSKVDVAITHGTDAVELRIDGVACSSEVLRSLVQEAAGRARLVVTCRSDVEGGLADGDALHRAARLAASIGDADVLVDFEYRDWQASVQARTTLLQALAHQGHGDGQGSGHSKQLILSYHDFDGKPTEVDRIVEEILKVGGVAKVAYFARCATEVLDALDVMHKHGRRVVVIAMGEFGLWARVLSKKLGAFGCYCSLDKAEATAPGQATLDELLNQYRWAGHDEKTQVYGVIGDPVAHSMSPSLFNRWFEELGLNAVYLPIRVDRKRDSVANFLAACARRAWLDLGGLSVTVPHKEAALRWAGDRADKLARGIGAANTLAFTSDGVRAYNTDCYAAIDSMADVLHCDRNDLAKTSVDVLGAGGAARAVLAGLHELGCRVTVYGRTAERVQALAAEFGVTAAEWTQRNDRRGAMLVNCTTVGMWPAGDRSPMDKDKLSGCELVFDLIYNPLETRLLQDARKVGVRTLNGLDMFVRQASSQLTLWTGKSVDCESARAWLERELVNQGKTPT